jgi:prepilin-type N-terminal cleavage/methylation domain-containing protein
MKSGRGVKKNRGLTLVEVLVVVVLIGILATIATVVYRHYVTTMKTAEAAQNIGGIAASQQAYKAEMGSYINVSGQLDHLYPAATPGMFKTEWGGPCNTCLRPWTALAFKPTAPVTFGYATVASQSAIPQELGPDPGGGGGGGPGGGKNQFGHGGGTIGTSITDPGTGDQLPDATGPYFTIIAKGDSNGDGVYSSALYYSETNNIVFDLAGE